ncbi:MAG: CvpA family protein [Synergistaceae bacterium]|nr:CvpA family protein [Synergistaceae bacterium]
MGQNIALIFDLVMIIVLVFFIWRGFIRGFSGEIISLVGFFVAIFCAWHFLAPAVDLFKRFLPSMTLDETVISIICGVVIFFGVEIIFAIIGAVLSYVVKVAQLTITDHFLGVVIGCVKTFCIIVFIYAVASSFPGVIPEETLEQSYCMKGASFVWPPLRDVLTQMGVLDFSALTGGK